jgi:hypothetical protein
MSYPIAFRISILLLSIGLTHPAAFCQQRDLSPLITLKKGYSTDAYPPFQKDRCDAFAIAPPGYSLVVTRGGCYLAGFKTWLVAPHTCPLIAIEPNRNDPDSALLLLRIDVKNRRTLLQKSRRFNSIDSIHSLVILPFGIYDLLPIDRNAVGLWGSSENGSHVWISDLKTLTPVYSGTAVIRDAALVKKDCFVLAIDSSLVLVGTHTAPKELIRIDMNIESVAADTDGTLYVSTEKGILHFSSMDKDDFDVITKVIHGHLRIYNSQLYVRWRENNEIVQIKLK